MITRPVFVSLAPASVLDRQTDASLGTILTLIQCCRISQVFLILYVVRFIILNHISVSLSLYISVASIQTCIARPRQELRHQTLPQAIHVCLYPGPPPVDADSFGPRGAQMGSEDGITVADSQARLPHTAYLWFDTQLSSAHRQPLLIQPIPLTVT